MDFRPELLSPAGSLEKLKVAVLYGADAVYCGGQKFGLRTAAENFTDNELIEGVQFAHQHGAKVFVVLNGFLHDSDLVALPEFLSFLDKIKVDAVIVSDLGVIETVKSYTNIPIHLSTQASCLNIESAKMWEKMGVKRVILGREASVEEGRLIKNHTNLEVEMFIHGSMCMAYSGNCVISNYTSGRDSNRGGCAHSCRFEYQLKSADELESKSSFFMSSKDLNGIEQLPEFMDAKIDSLKIEGRMKGHLYAATVTKSYAECIDEWNRKNLISNQNIKKSNQELKKISHRNYTNASLVDPAASDSVFDERENLANEYETVGVVADCLNGKFIIVEIKKAFFQGDELELLMFKGGNKKVLAHTIYNLDESEEISKTRPGSLVKVPCSDFVPEFTLCRRKTSQISGEV